MLHKNKNVKDHEASSQIPLSNAVFQKEEAGLLGEMADSKAIAENIQDEFGASCSGRKGVP